MTEIQMNELTREIVSKLREATTVINKTGRNIPHMGMFLMLHRVVRRINSKWLSHGQPEYPTVAFRYEALNAVALVEFNPLDDEIHRIQLLRIQGASPLEHGLDIQAMARRDFLTKRAAELEERVKRLRGRR